MIAIMPAHSACAECCRNLEVMQGMATTWLPLLLNAMLSMDPGERSTVESAVSSYACICDPAFLAQLFRAAMVKLIKASGKCQCVFQ